MMRLEWILHPVCAIRLSWAWDWVFAYICSSRLKCEIRALEKRGKARETALEEAMAAVRARLTVCGRNCGKSGSRPGCWWRRRRCGPV